MERKKVIYNIAAILLALCVWQVAAMLVDEKILLVSPLQVCKRLFRLLQEKDFYKTVLFSLNRIGTGFAFGFILGTVLGIVAGRHKIIKTLLMPYMTTIKSVPVASFIVIALIWIASSKLPSFISFLIVLPIVYSNVLTGIQDVDEKLLQVSRLYNFSLKKRLIYIHLPQLKPYILSACSVSIGLALKSGVAAEVIAISDGSIGEMLYNAKVYFDTADLFAWTVVIVVLSVAFEKLITLCLKSLYKAVERL